MQWLLNDINLSLIINVLVLIIMIVSFRRHGLGRRRAHVPRPATPLLHALTARTHVPTAALHAALILLRLYTPKDLLLTIYITLLLQICIYQANPYQSGILMLKCRLIFPKPSVIVSCSTNYSHSM